LTSSPAPWYVAVAHEPGTMAAHVGRECRERGRQEDTVATELGGTQISSLMETLPGIASVLRSPVADAFVGVIRAAVRLGEFDFGHAEEILRYAVRRNLMTQDETDRVLAEVRGAVERRAERDRGRKAAAATRAKARAKAKAPAKARKPAKKATKAPRKAAAKRRR
jgi:hypothetical protein